MFRISFALFLSLLFLPFAATLISAASVSMGDFNVSVDTPLTGGQLKFSRRVSSSSTAFVYEDGAFCSTIAMDTTKARQMCSLLLFQSDSPTWVTTTTIPSNVKFVLDSF